MKYIQFTGTNVKINVTHTWKDELFKQTGCKWDTMKCCRFTFLPVTQNVLEEMSAAASGKTAKNKESKQNNQWKQKSILQTPPGNKQH